MPFDLFMDEPFRYTLPVDHGTHKTKKVTWTSDIIRVKVYKIKKANVPVHVQV